MKLMNVLLLTLCAPLLGCALLPRTAPQEGTAKLEFHSFSGGGPSFRVVMEDESLVDVKETFRYHKKDHEDLDGAGYDVYFTFTGKKPGITYMTVEERSPIAGNFDHRYEVAVDGKLRVTLTTLSTVDLDAAAEPRATLVIETERRAFYAALEDNPSAEALKDRLNDGPIAVEMTDYGHFEKVGLLPWSLMTSDEEITTEPGDVILYQGDKLTIYYDENTWTFTRLAKIEDVTREELLEALGDGDVTVLLYLEWSE